MSTECFNTTILKQVEVPTTPVFPHQRFWVKELVKTKLSKISSDQLSSQIIIGTFKNILDSNVNEYVYKYT